LIHQDIGYTAVNTGEIWNKHPEKSFGMRAAWVDKNPKAAQAITMAVMEAQQWADKAENKEELATIMGKRQWINCPVEDILDRTKASSTTAPARWSKSSPHVMKYWSDHASYPFQSHDLWFLTEDIRWGKYEAGFDSKGADCQGQPRGYLARCRKKLSASPPPIFPRRNRAARRPSSTARCSIRKNPAAYLKSLVHQAC